MTLHMKKYEVSSFGTTPGQTMHYYKFHPEALIHLWSCKRDILSTASCDEFLQTCERIKACMINVSGSVMDEMTVDLPQDDTCFSPLPLSTIRPTPVYAAGGRWIHPAAQSEAINYVLPLEKTYPRILEDASMAALDGWQTDVSQSVRKRRMNLFFNLFLEDCRSKHQFEGFLIEPYLSEKVDYLICSVPFGIERQRENPLVAQGCEKIQRACEKMKKCYIDHVEYFRFHEFINRNVFTLAIIMLVIFLLSLTLTVITQYLYPVNTPGAPQF